MSHFKREHVPFFNKTTFSQLKDAADSVLACEKSTSLVELFSVELKFTVDTLNDWFSSILKPKFLEVGTMKKQAYKKENPIDKQKTICSICGSLLDVNSRGWIDFVVRCEYLFLKNIYYYEELEKIKIGSEEKFFAVVRVVFEYYPIFEETLQDCDEYDQISDRVQDFLVEYLDDAYDDSKELRENIANIQVLKKDYLLKEKLAFSLTN